MVEYDVRCSGEFWSRPMHVSREREAGRRRESAAPLYIPYVETRGRGFGPKTAGV
jgi:hypothetical protein